MEHASVRLARPARHGPRETRAREGKERKEWAAGKGEGAGPELGRKPGWAELRQKRKKGPEK